MTRQRLARHLDLGQAVAGRLPQAEAFFARVSGSGANGPLITGEPLGVAFWLLVTAANTLLIRRGLARGIEAYLSLGAAADGAVRADRPRPRADARHARSGAPRAQRLEALAALDTMDFWVGTVAIFVLAGVEVVCVSHIRWSGGGREPILLDPGLVR